MEHTNQQIIAEIERLLKVTILKTSIPPQGMDSSVFFIIDEAGREYAIKVGNKAFVDVKAYSLLIDNKIKVPVPKVYGSFIFENKEVVILEKINYPLLETVQKESIGKYIPSMVHSMNLIHKIKSTKADYINSDKTTTWKDMLTSTFSSENSTIDWNKVAKRDGLEQTLILKSVDKLLEKIDLLVTPQNEYCFSHTDFNQRNLFIDPSSDKIAGIIDWSEASFCDPLYDFARIRMFIWHFDLGQSVIENYYKIMNYTKEEKRLEDLYWLSRVIEYLAYYSEELNDFNVGRIQLHQNYLRGYNWNF